jgi:hypothetical protein
VANFPPTFFSLPIDYGLPECKTKFYTCRPIRATGNFADITFYLSILNKIKGHTAWGCDRKMTVVVRALVQVKAVVHI